MKKSISISALVFAVIFSSCEKNNSDIKAAELQAVNNNGNSKTMCITENPKVVDCDKTYAPVCGCNSVTYSNACDAQNQGVLRWVSGTCDENGGGYPGDGPNR